MVDILFLILHMRKLYISKLPPKFTRSNQNLGHLTPVTALSATRRCDVQPENGEKVPERLGISFPSPRTLAQNWGKRRGAGWSSKAVHSFSLCAGRGHHRKHPLTFSALPGSTEHWATQIKAFGFLSNLRMKTGSPLTREAGSPVLCGQTEIIHLLFFPHLSLNFPVWNTY